MSMLVVLRNTSPGRTTGRRTRILRWMSRWWEMRPASSLSVDVRTSGRDHLMQGHYRHASTSSSSPNDLKSGCKSSSTCELSTPEQLKSPRSNSLSSALLVSDRRDEVDEFVDERRDWSCSADEKYSRRRWRTTAESAWRFWCSHVVFAIVDIDICHRNAPLVVIDTIFFKVKYL